MRAGLADLAFDDDTFVLFEGLGDRIITLSSSVMDNPTEQMRKNEQYVLRALRQEGKIQSQRLLCFITICPIDEGHWGACVVKKDGVASGGTVFWADSLQSLPLRTYWRLFVVFCERYAQPLAGLRVLLTT